MNAAGRPVPIPPPQARIGYVVIARNGGERLIRSLRSVLALGGPVVYADSGSTDGSPGAAERLGAEVIRLDDSVPQTAARGRNAGFGRITAQHPSLEFVQFVDGDTEIMPGWPAAAVAALDANPRIAVICGRLRERDRDEHIYGRLFEMEWDGPVGEIQASGGIAMMRVGPFAESGGFDATLAAGEEGDLCVRLRRAGHVVVRIADPMGEHDSAINRFSQWWTRAVRVGRAWADISTRNQRPSALQRARTLAGTLLWAAALPLLAIGGAAAAWWYPPAVLLSALVLVIYLLFLWRIYRRARRIGRSPADARLYSLFCLVAKWPHLTGMLRFWVRG